MSPCIRAMINKAFVIKGLVSCKHVYWLAEQRLYHIIFMWFDELQNYSNTMDVMLPAAKPPQCIIYFMAHAVLCLAYHALIMKVSAAIGLFLSFQSIMADRWVRFQEIVNCTTCCAMKERQMEVMSNHRLVHLFTKSNITEWLLSLALRLLF